MRRTSAERPPTPAPDAHAAASQGRTAISPARLLAWPSISRTSTMLPISRAIALGIDRLQPRRLADHLAGLAAGLGEQHRHGRADLGGVEGARLAAEQRLQGGQPRRLHALRHLVGHRRARRAGTAAVLEGIGRRRSPPRRSAAWCRRSRASLSPGKADDEVGRQGEIGPRGAQAIDEAQEEIAAVAGGSSPRGCGRSRTAPAGAGTASAAAPRRATAISSSSMSRGWEVV